MAERKLKIGRRKRIALLTASVCLGTAAAESALRVMVCVNARSLRPLFRGTVRTTLMIRGDPIRNHAFIEGVTFAQTGRPPGFEYCVFGKVSSQGLVDDEVPIEKAPGEKRVLVLGDSFVAAPNVPRDRNFCERIETRLSERASALVRVVNAGVATYSPLLEYLHYKHELRRFKPDVVVMVLFANDVFDDLRYSQTAKYDAAGIPTAVPPGAPWLALARDGVAKEDVGLDQRRIREAFRAAPPWLPSRFYLAALANHVLITRRIRSEFPQPPVNDEFFILEDNPKFDAARKKGWALVRRHISLLKQECDRDGAVLMLTTAPIAAQVHGKSSYDHFFFRDRPTNADQVELKKIAAALGVKFIDLLGPLRRGGRGLYFRRDGHWTPKGHRVVAEAIEPHLNELVRRTK